MHINNYLLDRLGHLALRRTMRSNRKSQAKKELTKIVGQAHETIFSTATVFPFTFFPDSITIDRTKLTITHRLFFKVAEVVSIKLEDILNVTTSVGPFFGSVQIHTKFFDSHKPYTINFLTRQDALKIERIMHGYNIALKENIDCSSLDTKELASPSKRLCILNGAAYCTK